MGCCCGTRPAGCVAIPGPYAIGSGSTTSTATGSRLRPPIGTQIGDSCPTRTREPVRQRHAAGLAIAAPDVRLMGNVVMHDNGGSEAGGSRLQRAGDDHMRSALSIRRRSHDATRNVHFVKARAPASPTMRRSTKRRTWHLDGDVLVDGRTFRAEVVDYNLQTKDVKSSGAPIVIREPVQSPTPGPPPSPRPSRRP